MGLRKSLVVFALLSGLAKAEEDAPVSVDLLRDSVAAPAVSKERIAAINAEVKELRKKEFAGNLMYAAGVLAWIPLVIDDNAVTFSSFLAIWAVHEAGLGVNYYANTNYRSLYREIGGEESFLRYGGQGAYLITRVLSIGGAGLVTLGALNGDDDLLLGGVAGMVLGEICSVPVWRTLHNSNLELASGIRNWNLNAGLTLRGDPVFALTGAF